MIAGQISNRRATIHLPLRRPNGQDIDIEAVLDTGFTGYLTLPPVVVASLGLPFAHPMRAVLADGNRVTLRVYAATVLWDGEERDIDVFTIGNEPLVGMSLLEGSDVRLQVTDGGLVTIERL